MSQTGPRSSGSNLEKDNDFQYVGTELEVFAGALRWKSYFAQQLKPFITGDVLEVGAGIGGTTRVLASSQVNSWTCLEPDAELAGELRKVVETDPFLSSLPITVAVSSLAELADDEKFDAILYIDVLEHIEHDAEELKHASEHLNPNGHLIVLSPAHQFLWSPFDAAIGHFQRYSLKMLRDAGPADCKLVRLRYLDSVGLLASLANRLVLKSSSPNKKQIAFWDRFMVPISRLLDPLFTYRVGKSVIGIWRK